MAYSFWASMMMSVESVGVAEEGAAPIRVRKDFVIFLKFGGGVGGGS